MLPKERSLARLIGYADGRPLYAVARTPPALFVESTSLLTQSITLDDNTTIDAYPAQSRVLVGGVWTVKDQGWFLGANGEVPDGQRHLCIPVDCATLTPPAAPTLGQATGGVLGNLTYYVVITFITPRGETSISAEVSRSVDPGHVLTVTAGGYSNATNWNVYVGETAGSETLQATLAMGATWTEPTSGLVTGAATPASNPCLSVWAADEGSSLSYAAFLQNDFALSVGSGANFLWQNTGLSLTLPAGSYLLSAQVSGEALERAGPTTNGPAEMFARFQITSGTATLSAVPGQVLITPTVDIGRSGRGRGTTAIQGQLVAQTETQITLFAMIADAQGTLTISYAIVLSNVGPVCSAIAGTSLTALRVGSVTLANDPPVTPDCHGSGSGSGSGSGGGGTGPFFSTLCPGNVFNTSYTLTLSGGCAVLNGTYVLTWNGSNSWVWSGAISGHAITLGLGSDGGNNNVRLFYSADGSTEGTSAAASMTCPPTFTASGSFTIGASDPLCPGNVVNWSIS